MRILVFNQCWLIKELKEAGHEVRSVGMHPDCDARGIPPLMHVNTILSQYLNNFEPECIILWDNSAPITVVGLEDSPIPIFFYSVDTHHHYEYHKYLARVFDQTYIAQKDYLCHFSDSISEVKWMPLWASRWVDVSSKREYGPVFVGNLNKTLNPQRVEFFENLKQKRDVLTTMGEFWNIFPFAEVVLNQTVKGDLNFRVFEALMCGVPFITERSPNGLLEIFRENVHLLCYEKHNVDDMVEKIDWVKSNPEKAAEIGIVGREEVINKHLPQHRLESLEPVLRTLKKVPGVSRRYPMFINFSVLARRMQTLDQGYARMALVHAMRIMTDAMNDGEVLTSEIACHCILSAITYDREFRSNAGEQIIERLSDQYPEEKLLHLSRIRSLLNRGDKATAQKFAQTMFVEETPRIFSAAEEVVTSILGEFIRT